MFMSTLSSYEVLPRHGFIWQDLPNTCVEKPGVAKCSQKKDRGQTQQIIHNFRYMTLNSPPTKPLFSLVATYCANFPNAADCIE